MKNLLLKLNIPGLNSARNLAISIDGQPPDQQPVNFVQGRAELTLSIPDQAQTVSVKPAQFLRQRAYVPAGEAPVLELTSFRPGDIDDSNFIDADDMAAFNQALDLVNAAAQCGLAAVWYQAGDDL
jgi:hypothetical protein